MTHPLSDPQFDDTSTNHHRHVADTSPTGLPLFDSVRAAKARDAAIDQVGANADTRSANAIREAIEATARELAAFTSDEVWRRVPPEHREGIEPRLLGALMRDAARRGIIQAMPGVFRASDMVSCHRRPKQVWRSLWRAT